MNSVWKFYHYRCTREWKGGGGGSHLEDEIRPLQFQVHGVFSPQQLLVSGLRSGWQSVISALCHQSGICVDGNRFWLSSFPLMKTPLGECAS
ncbi:hypothetical protein CEXT_237461 [Caerostris extrusa]|uniref:Uncharacterized protein n=1 Tax=Caerostris extrusa TaxID=172846 RepID=A0AAV4VGF5_CAEEX|nr:hypothetical protein CEXT_237461 [Caerostris extrusa]